LSTDQKELPSTMWVVTRAYVRAGKPPVKIAPYAWACHNGKITGVKSASGHGCKEMLYLPSDCYETLGGAIDAMNAIIKNEIEYEQLRLNKIRGRLLSARKLSAMLVA